MIGVFSRTSGYAVSLVLYYVDEEYREIHPNILTTVGNEKTAWEKAVRIAKENGLLYYFCKRLLEDGGKLPSDSLRTMIRREEKNLIKLRKTLHFASSLFEEEGLDFRIIKLYRGIPYAPRDVDILVREKQKQQIFSALKSRGVTVKTFNGVETQCEKEGLLKIDLYQGFYYLSVLFLDAEFLWKGSRTVNICGVKCPILNLEADFLSLLIHALLGHRCLGLLDFLYAKSLINGNLTFNELVQQAEKHRWYRAFQTMLSTIQTIYHQLYLNPNTTKSTIFPYAFSSKFILKALQGFVGLPVSTEKKFVFIFSTLIDNIYLRYQRVQRSAPVEMPAEIKDFMMKFMHKVRSLSGDRKFL